MSQKASILLVDYYGTCDSKGKSIGHSPKVAQEYAQLVSPAFTTNLLASPCIIKSVEHGIFADCKELPYNIFETRDNSIKKRIIDKIKLFYNIRKVYQTMGNYDIVWFYRVDFFLFLYLTFHRKPLNCKLVCLICHTSYLANKLDQLLNRIVQNALKKVDMVIYTQKMQKKTNLNSCVIPDYYFFDKYNEFRKTVKKEKVVCLGTMSIYKKLEELIDVFNQIDYNLEIVGRFADPLRADKLKGRMNINIYLEDCSLTFEDYYKKLGEAKYAILPYDMKQYDNRTSGVLLESVFLNTIPIAPRQLLEQNDIPGVAYCDITDLINYDFNQNEKFNYDDICDKYHKQKIQSKLINKLKSL